MNRKSTDPASTGVGRGVKAVLVVGATGSIGRLVVAEALAHGYAVRALVRDAGRARGLGKQVELVVADLAEPATLHAAVADIDAIIFTHGSQGGGKAGSESVDYGGVRNILRCLAGRHVRLALMTAIGVTERLGPYNRTSEAHDWKRRGERLVRASGLPYTIVRPGWFDYNDDDQQRLVMLQGDRRHAGDPGDGVVSRRQIAQVLVHSLGSNAALCKTFELVAERGAATRDIDTVMAALDEDQAGSSIDGVRDLDNMPFADEPERVRHDMQSLRSLSILY